MATLMRMLRPGNAPESRYSLDEYMADVQEFWYSGNAYVPTTRETYGATSVESIDGNFEGLVRGAYRRNGIVFACEVSRLSVFSQATFSWRQMRSTGPADLFRTPGLEVLRNPWVNGSEGELLARMIQDVDTVGNAYIRKRPPTAMSDNALERLRPDWVDIVLAGEPGMMTPTILGYLYHPDGRGGRLDPLALAIDEVAHWSPYPDPLATYRGMAPLTPIIRDVMGDNAATSHKIEFFEHAAPQPLTAGVLTPSGWTVMGALSVGDEVIGRDGKAHPITGVYPQGIKPIYRVRFGDGAVTECTDDHVWSVASGYDIERGVLRDLTLRQMLDGGMPSGREVLTGGLHYPSGGAKWSVPYPEPVQYEPVDDLPVDPYLLGLLLGDGCLRGAGAALAAHTDDADETASIVEPMLPPGMSLSRRDGDGTHSTEFYLKGSTRPNALAARLRTLGVWDKLAHDKFVPERYLRADISDRVALLQGLIDSDGSVAGPLVRFDTVSERLANDLVDLARSLGGYASLRVRQRTGRTQYHVNVCRLPEGIVPCRLRRKAASYRQSKWLRWRSIVGVEYVGPAPAQCIRVDVPDSLYVTDDFIVTHNTPNMAVKFDPTISFEKFTKFKDAMEAEHAGTHNAWKTLYLGGGADTTPVGLNFKDMDYKAIQALGETRIAAAYGVPAVIAQISEGLAGSSLNVGNFSAARRLFADKTMRWLWKTACASLERLVVVPNRAHLWWDEREVSFLREDQKDASDIQAQQASTIATLVREGFTPESVIASVQAQDFTLLVHTGALSVQLYEPGTGPQAPTAPNAPTAPGTGSGSTAGEQTPAPGRSAMNGGRHG